MGYKTDFFYRPVVQNNAPMAAGTYARGQFLGRVTDTGVYAAYDPDGDDGTETIRAVAVNSQTLAAAGYGAIAKGEFQKEGIIAVNSGVTMDDALIGALFDAGIILN
ncbi:MAG: head decoration protein [Treponema sp.]|jgi:hypothetical protein|nr:head decoration protein [Treponema sp.]